MSILTLFVSITTVMLLTDFGVRAWFLYNVTYQHLLEENNTKVDRTLHNIINEHYKPQYKDELHPSTYHRYVVNRALHNSTDFISAITIDTGTEKIARKNNEPIDIPFDDPTLDDCCVRYADSNLMGRVTVYGYIDNDRLSSIVFKQLPAGIYLILINVILMGIFIRFFIVSQIHSLVDAMKMVDLMDIKEIELFSFISEIDNIKEAFNYILLSLKSMNDESTLKTDSMVYMSTHDNLTGLPNRKLLQYEIERSISKTELDHNHKFALMDIDIDYFKDINDTHGHHIGDMVLIAVVNRLKLLTRDNDILAHIGGDEFILLFNDVESVDEVHSMAKQILHTFTTDFIINDNNFLFGCSIGITLYPDNAMNYNDLLKQAATTMFDAKISGRNRYHFFTDGLAIRVEDKGYITTELRAAIKNAEITTMFQPKVDGTSNKIVRLEALIRWDKGVQLISPSVFLHIAVQSSVIMDLDWIVLRQSIDFIVDLKTYDYNTVEAISINIDEKTMYDDTFISKLTTYMCKMGCDPSWIELEISANTLLTNFNEIAGVMKDLESYGVKFSLDDLGAGYSYLSYLKKLPITSLTIDKSFIDGIPADEDDIVIIKTIITVAKKLGIQIVAVGVETHNQKQWLLDYGCDLIQGFVHHPALMRKQVHKLLSNT